MEPKLRRLQATEYPQEEPGRRQVRVQQVRENVQGDDVFEPAQAARVRRRALRGMYSLRTQIQAQVRPERPRRGLREENESGGAEGLRLRISRSFALEDRRRRSLNQIGGGYFGRTC